MRIKKTDLKQTLFESIRYIIAGVLTTVISIGSYCLLTIFLDPKKEFELICANIISWFISVTFAYFINAKFVFLTKSQKKAYLKFCGARIGTLVLECIIMYIGVSLIEFNDKIMKLIVQVIIVIVNYLISKFLIFVKAKEISMKSQGVDNDTNR